MLRLQHRQLTTRFIEQLGDHLLLNRVGLACEGAFEALDIVPQDESPHESQHELQVVTIS